MVSSMRRVAAISDGPRSVSPRGSLALSLLVLSDLLGLSAIWVYIATVGLVAAAPRSGKRVMQRQGSDHVTGADAESERRSQRSRSLLAAVHAEPGVQGRAAPLRARQGHALLYAGRPRGARRHRRPMVHQCGAQPRPDRPGDRRAGG